MTWTATAAAQAKAANDTSVCAPQCVSKGRSRLCVRLSLDTVAGAPTRDDAPSWPRLLDSRPSPAAGALRAQGPAARQLPLVLALVLARLLQKACARRASDRHRNVRRARCAECREAIHWGDQKGIPEAVPRQCRNRSILACARTDGRKGGMRTSMPATPAKPPALGPGRASARQVVSVEGLQCKRQRRGAAPSRLRAKGARTVRHFALRALRLRAVPTSLVLCAAQPTAAACVSAPTSSWRVCLSQMALA